MYVCAFVCMFAASQSLALCVCVFKSRYDEYVYIYMDEEEDDDGVVGCGTTCAPLNVACGLLSVAL